MNRQLPESSYDPADAPPPPPTPDPTRVWAAYGVSAAAGLHIIAAALVLINRPH
ncbi:MULTISPECIES: hypothetical protein [Kitasatospora]|uniref:Energy transducer TonB n=1 Tax=Kitasatospora cathayae TaxID=3004092 RepID=A0ABY7Q1T3_9ACTN|nr:hypothetical protein [Kitasatospora sp. HUAS 3-15]WBP86549.1 hypothetical protein O1G21_12320 [Kitasatospora sp. HUAS 3-15]